MWAEGMGWDAVMGHSNGAPGWAQHAWKHGPPLPPPPPPSGLPAPPNGHAPIPFAPAPYLPRQAKLDFSFDPWPTLSRDVKMLLRRMLVKASQRAS